MTSTTAAKNPERTMASRDRPPVPLAWKTCTSLPRAVRESRTASTHAVVTPNMEHAMAGADPKRSEGGAPRTMPAQASAARARMPTLIELRPAMSTTGYIIVRSLVPTYGRVSPATTVDTRTFGQPIGSAAATWLITKPALEPPSIITPDTRPWS